jgi:enamine deaminase RidA (YjgF/YER057c/UK114 family)
MSLTVNFQSPANMPPAQGYSQVVRVESAELIYLSGQVGLDQDGQLAGADYASQLDQAFRNIQTGLEAAGAGLEDLIKLNYFVRADVPTEEVLANLKVRDRYINRARPPASALVFVVRLARPEWLVEVEVIAARPA